MENILTKTYEDGIRDAIEIVERWKYVAILGSAINTILIQLNKLLSTTAGDENYASKAYKGLNND